MKRKRINPVKGFGARYGSSVRKKYVRVFTVMKRKHRCGNCGSLSVVRKSVGLWVCRKCGLTFTGGAYTPSTKLGTIASRIARRA